MKIYALKDDKSQTFQGSYCFVNNALCVRSFDALFQQRKLDIINQYPEDFAIYQIADFDETTGAVTPHLDFVANFSDFVRPVHDGQ